MIFIRYTVLGCVALSAYVEGEQTFTYEIIESWECECEPGWHDQSDSQAKAYDYKNDPEYQKPYFFGREMYDDDHLKCTPEVIPTVDPRTVPYFTPPEVPYFQHDSLSPEDYDFGSAFEGAKPEPKLIKSKINPETQPKVK